MEKDEEELDLCFLLEREREMILKVLQKDEKLRKQEEKRIRRLKNELLEIKMRGSRRNQEAGERQCARCLKMLGLIFDRGDLCEDCHLCVCNQCRVAPSRGRQWKCNVCAKISELKVVTGEWFIEERSKRFEKGTRHSSDMIKETILSSPTATDNTSPECSSTPDKQVPLQSEPPDTPRSSRSAILNVVDGSKRKGLKGWKPGLKLPNKVKGGSLHSLLDTDTHSVNSVHSDPSSCAYRASGQAMEPSGVLTVPNNLRSNASDQSSLPGDVRRFRPDGAESIASFQSSESVSNKLAVGSPRAQSTAPTIAVSRASGSSDHSPSELDLSAASSEPSDDLFSLRSRSIPGFNGSEFSDDGEEEDIDALISAGRVFNRDLSSAVSSSSTPGSERRWSYLNVPDSDAETSSINSVMSMYSETGDYGDARVSGEILLNISYSYKTGALNLLVKECHNLATGDEKRQRTDAYVKTYLLPDKSRQSKRKTSIKANSTNPVFNENLRYVISHSQLETRVLQVSVWHHDRFRQNSFLGEVEVTFDSWEFDSKMEEWYALQPKADNSIDSTMPYKGELTVVLKYIPAEKNLSQPLDHIHVNKKSFMKGKKSSSFTLPEGGMVELLVKEAKNLTAVKSGGTSDPFVKGYLLPDSNKTTKHKTAVERRTVNPRWNHTFTYCGLQPGDLNNVCLELTVWDKEALASNVFLGGVRLGAGTGNSYGTEVDWMDSYGEEQRLWQRMTDNPEVPQECTLMLRSSMRKNDT